MIVSNTATRLSLTRLTAPQLSLHRYVSRGLRTHSTLYVVLGGEGTKPTTAGASPDVGGGVRGVGAGERAGEELFDRWEELVEGWRRKWKKHAPAYMALRGRTPQSAAASATNKPNTSKPAGLSTAAGGSGAGSSFTFSAAHSKAEADAEVEEAASFSPVHATMAAAELARAAEAKHKEMLMKANGEWPADGGKDEAPTPTPVHAGAGDGKEGKVKDVMLEVDDPEFVVRLGVAVGLLLLLAQV